MKLLNLKANSAEWLAERKKGLGASDAPIVLNVSPYKTRFQLWETKLNLRPDDAETMITNLGHQFEPRARATFDLQNNTDMVEAFGIHSEYPYLRASFDGLDEGARAFLEIKMVGKKNMELLKASQAPPEHHAPQVAQQFLVSGYEKGYYAAYCLNEKKTEIVDFVSFQVEPPSKQYTTILFNALTAFWKLVQTQTPPELDARDEYEFKDKELIMLSNDYQVFKNIIKLNQIEIDKIDEKFKAVASKHARARIGNLTITKSVRKGNVDYAVIPELKSVDVEKYRKAPSTVTTIRVGK